QDGYQFINWTGACSGAATPCDLLMDAPKTVGALFLETDDPAIGSPISVVAGTQITLTYSGSTDDADEIGIYLPESENNNPEARVRLPDQAGSVEIRVPRVPGNYELRMVNDKDELIVFDGVLDVQPYAGTIEPSVTATTPTRRISVAFTGSTHSTDRLGIFAIGSDNSQALKFATLSQDEGSVEIEAPPAEGTYEFRIVSNDQYTIATGPELTLQYGDASIAGPSIVLPEEAVTITYTGSTETRDRVALFAQIANGYRSSRTTNGGDGQMDLVMPDETGIYDLALINAGQYRIANGGYISVLNPEKAEVFPAPELARINETLTVAYSGAESLADSLDWVGLFRQGEPVENYLEQVFVPEGTAVGNVSFDAPATDDIYEVRLVANDGTVRATHYVYVQDPSVNAVFIPESIVAGDTVVVPYSKPAGGNGRIGIYPQGEADNRRFIASTTANSALGYVQLRVPTTPGDYEVRSIDSAYELIAQGNDFAVTPYDMSLTLSTAFTTPADTISATYSGSTHQSDRLGFYLPGAANNDFESSVVLSDDEGVVTVRVPGVEGVYDVRVINNRNETILDAGQITLGYGELSLSAAEIAYPGEMIPVSFEGSTETTDKVIMVAQDGTNAVRSLNTGDLSSGEIDFRVPSDPGIYDLKLVNPTNAVIALGGFVSVLDPADKDVFVAAETVHIGDTVTIAYSGAEATVDAPESVGIYALDAENDNAIAELSITDLGQGVVTLSVPGSAGIYHVRLINADGTLAATSNHLKVINSDELAVYAPVIAIAGETVKVIFSGSTSNNDRVRFVAEGETNLRNYISNTTARDEEGWLNLRVPTIPGRYEVKLVSSTEEVLADGHVFTVSPYDATLSIQSFATPSSTIDFQY
ncbi:MAG: hypothetical protein MI867_17980, partial [Pseudomonadales bacterium]|nr:hypothetical protein [Pseudomonadales bacterium]